MQVKNIAECSKGSILQYFRPSLSYHLSLRSLFCLFLSCRFIQVLLYARRRIKQVPFSGQKNIGRVWVDSLKMTAKCSDAQPMVEYEKQLP